MSVISGGSLEGYYLFHAARAAAHPDVDMIEVTIGKPPAEIASQLRLAASGKAVVRSRRYLLDGRSGGGCGVLHPD